jgi:hypothetical protein
MLLKVILPARACDLECFLTGQHCADVPIAPMWELAHYCVECGVEIVVVHGF